VCDFVVPKGNFVKGGPKQLPQTNFWDTLARMDRRRLNAELHRSLHRTRTIWLDSMCLRRSLSLEDCLFWAAFVRRWRCLSLWL